MDLLIYIAKSALILSIFYLTYIIVLRRDTFFTAHRHYFLAGIIAALILPFITFTQTIYIDIPATTPIEYVAQAISYPMVSDSISSDIPTPTNWWQIVFFIYGVGILIMSIRFMIQLRSLHKLIRKNERLKKEGYTHVQVHKPISPFSFFRHIVYNPDLHNAKELRMIITHEKVHGRQWHTIDMLLTQLLLIIQWVNPLAWLYRKSLEQNLEFIADNKAIARVASKKEYQLALVKCYHSLIKKRIVMLNKQASRKHNLLKLGIVLPLLAIFLYSFNVKKITAYNEVQDTIDRVEEVSASAKAEHQEIATLPVQKDVANFQQSEKVQVKKDDETATITTSQNAVQSPASNNSNLAIVSRIPNNTQSLPQLATINTLPVTSPKIYLTRTTIKNDASVFKIKITKNTSDVELKKIKKELKDKHEIDFSYNTSRNDNGEIISLSIQYSSKTGSGNMSVNGDDTIEDVIFYRDEDGSVGILSGSKEEHLRRQAERMERRARELQERHVARVEELQHRLEERQEALEERLEERQLERQEHLRERMERSLHNGEEAHSELSEKQEHLREEIEEKREHLREEMEAKRAEIIAHREEIRQAARAHTRARRAKATEAYAKIARRADAQIIVITKDTSSDEIKDIKNRLKNEGFSFSFTKVKRNDRGEIMSYKMTFNDNKGTSSTSTHKSSDKPIEPLRIAYANGSISIE